VPPGTRYYARNNANTVIQQGRDGVVIVKTTQAILIAHYKDGMIAGNAATTVEQLADYLISTGY
jgi:profilin